jgi:hypothetical protein
LAPILVAFGGSFPQRRLIVLFRIILFIPQYFVLYALSIAAEVIAMIGWFAALFTGRLPEFAADFLGGYLRWQTRVTAYLLLLTDQYPPFSLSDADYPVRIAMRPGRLNRLAVFFRMILVIPASIVSGLLYWGACTIVLFVTWLIVLIAGRMPDALYQAMAAVLRYGVRTTGYMLLLTSAYPSGLFGDRPDPAQPWEGGAGFTAGPGGFPAPGGGYAVDPAQPGAPARGFAANPAQPAGPYGFSTDPAQPGTAGEYAADPAQPGPGDGPAYAPPAFAAGGPGLADPAGYAYPAGPGATGPGFAYPAAAGFAPGAVAWPASWRLVLSAGAKRLLVLFLALGVVGVAAYVAAIAFFTIGAGTSVNNRVTATNAANQVQAALAPLNQTMNSLGTNINQCQTAANPLACVTAADRQAADSFNNFSARLVAISVPQGAPQTALGQLNNSTTRARVIFDRLGSAKSAAQYQSLAGSLNISQAMSQFALDYQNLITALKKA